MPIGGIAVHKFNRSILSLFMSVIMFFVSLFSTGELPFTFDMPELSGGEYGKWVNPFVGTGGTLTFTMGNTPSANGGF